MKQSILHQAMMTFKLLHQILTTEAIQGAKKFTAGWGRSGKFNVNKVAEPEVGDK